MTRFRSDRSRHAMASLLAVVALWGCSEGANVPETSGTADGLRFRVAAPEGPLQAGSNPIRIRIDDEAGAPVNDAEVSVAWSMPAMGAMPAMQGRTRAEKSAPGSYRADIDLEMHGAWQLEIETHRPGGRSATIRGRISTGRAEIELEPGAPREPAFAAADHDHRGAHEPAEVRIDLRRRQQIGIRTGVVARAPLVVPVRAVGRVTLDERRLQDVSLKVRGWITTLHASALGDPVRAGEPLFELYSPELFGAQQEYLHARRSLAAAAGSDGSPRVEQLVRAARTRLRLWDVSERELDALDRRGAPSEAITIRAPISGFVIEKNVVEGAVVEPGARLLRIAPLDPVWVEADVYESQMTLIHPGQTVRISLPSLAGRQLEGRISYVYPALDADTRTARVRVELPNPDLAIRPDMYANVELRADLGERTLVPVSAVLYAGPRRIVFVDLGDGRLRPREVRIGLGNGEVYEVLEGLAPGEPIVLSGTYLVASESRLQSALGQW